LLAWYQHNARSLPWREDRDPYRVWLSEIMLQQTRVAAVIDHYRRFLMKFPTIGKLAQAREAAVLAAWSGLGYYRRARMLHAAAKVVVRERAGEFPKTAAALRELPGIGRYTAAAIASIAFGEPIAVVDGNVERVLARLLGRRLAGEDLWRTAQQLLEGSIGQAAPGDFNQALMELGATVCLPGAPKCLLCPLTHFCATRGELPAAASKARQKKRSAVYGLARRGKQVLLVKRPAQESLMAGMWELPRLTKVNGAHETLFNVRHSITVTDYRVRVVSLRSEDFEPGGPHWTPDAKWHVASRLTGLPITGLARKILRRTGII